MNAVISPNFLENLILLVITAIVTSFLIPYILKRIEERKMIAQKEFEATLQRQNKVIDSQIQLLEDLARFLWEYQLLAIEVSYYEPIKQKDLYVGAIKKYEEKSGELFCKIRAEISKSLRLVSSEPYKKLKSLYYDDLIQVDVKLTQLMLQQKDSKTSLAEWKQFNYSIVYELSEKVDNILDNLAEELHLKAINKAVATTERKLLDKN